VASDVRRGAEHEKGPEPRSLTQAHSLCALQNVQEVSV
jgi:hypothetical protein